MCESEFSLVVGIHFASHWYDPSRLTGRKTSRILSICLSIIHILNVKPPSCLPGLKVLQIKQVFCCLWFPLSAPSSFQSYILTSSLCYWQYVKSSFAVYGFHLVHLEAFKANVLTSCFCYWLSKKGLLLFIRFPVSAPGSFQSYMLYIDISKAFSFSCIELLGKGRVPRVCA